MTIVSDEIAEKAYRDRERNVMRLWRNAGLPEYFLGNGGTNQKLVAFADGLVKAEREAAAKIADHCACGWLSILSFEQRLRLDSEVAVETAEAIAGAIRARTTKDQT